MLKALNPLIWCWNFFNYQCHLETMRFCKVYEPYNFSRDLKFY